MLEPNQPKLQPGKSHRERGLPIVPWAESIWIEPDDGMVCRRQVYAVVDGAANVKNWKQVLGPSPTRIFLVWLVEDAVKA